MRLSKELHNFAKADGEYVGTGLAKYVSHEFDKEDSVIDRMPADRVFAVGVKALFKTPEKTYRLCWKYTIDDTAEISPSVEILAQSLESAINGEGKMNLNYTRIDKGGQRVPVSENDVSASTVTKSKRAIMAADGDDEDELDLEGFDDMSEVSSAPDVEDEEFATDIDDLSDQVDDIQDSLDEMVEDQPSIEIDNNISNHYIAECDNCHGIFISALVESEQKVDKIGGTCPLCEKEADAIIKWVVKDVAEDND